MVAEGGVDPEKLGRATWTFLHTLAATHPQNPTPKQQQRMSRFMSDFSQVYPCEPCAQSFRGIMKRFPADTQTGPGFAAWMCTVHNEVNKELGKDLFDCSRLAEKWGVCEECAAHQDKLHDFKSTFRDFKSLTQIQTSGDTPT